MYFENKITIVWIIIFVTVYREVIGGPPYFRVLAPEFVCPNDENAVIEKPDNTVITVKTDASDLQLSWRVRWTHLDRPSQRFTVLLWKTVRALEAKLNLAQPEPFVYIIDNAELLQGVEYIFDVTALDPESDNTTTARFAIDNIKGDPTLLIEGRSDKLSVILVGTEVVYADMKYVVEAEVTTCFPTQDYYFTWSIQSSSASPLFELDMSGSRLEIPPYTLQSGSTYYVSCAVYRNSREFVTQTGLPLQVLYRGLSVSLNFDVLIVTLNKRFEVNAVVQNHDHYEDKVKFEWSCIFESENYENFKSIDSEIIPISFLNTGKYKINVIVTVNDQEATSNATIFIIEDTLPVIQVESVHRIVNEHTLINLVANASNVAPSCTLSWYFANNEYLASSDKECDNCQHGIELPGSVTITSLEEVFLNELTDFSNETEWRQVEAQFKASTGRARFVAKCGCSLTFSCDTQGSVHADVYFELNEAPKVTEIKIFPVTGTAMETVFRVSTIAASDPDKPLRYSFYCSLGTNDTLLLASNLEHLATETFLPYVDASGTRLWVQVCDSLGACSSSDVRTVQILQGEGRTVSALVDSMRGHVARCEIVKLKQLVKSAVTTYLIAKQQGIMSKFTEALMKTLTTTENNHCTKGNYNYSELLDWLIIAGVDVSSLISN